MQDPDDTSFVCHKYQTLFFLITLLLSTFAYGQNRLFQSCGMSFRLAAIAKLGLMWTAQNDSAMYVQSKGIGKSMYSYLRLHLQQTVRAM